MGNKVKVAIIGSGNIGTDLMEKIIKKNGYLEVTSMIGIDPNSNGLARAKKLGIDVSHEGIDGLIKSDFFADIKIIFDATSASTHLQHNEMLKQHHSMHLIDLTPAAIGPYIVPVVNLDKYIDEKNLNMVTCGGQATIPIVAAISKVTDVLYAEIIASIASNSAGPGTRENIDEFTETTAAAIEQVGGAKRGKAIIILNPAEPPLLMRDTIFILTKKADKSRIETSIKNQVTAVQSYVPGYRLKQAVQFKEISQQESHLYPDLNGEEGLQISIFIEVEGAADYFPAYAGNLDIMTSAALACGERIAEKLSKEGERI